MTSNISTPSNSTPAKSRSNGSIITGALLIILGLAAIILPNLSTIVAETWIAAIIGTAGVTKLVYAFQTRAEGGFVWKLLLAVLYIATGVMLFVYPLTGILTLTLLLGSFLLTEGVFELILAFRLRPQENWSWVLVNGIVTLLLGAMIWFQWPFDAPWLIGTLVGASILFSGVSRVGLSLAPNPNRPDQAASA